MRSSSFALIACLVAIPASLSRAATTVNAGSIIEITGPGGLDLTGNIIYAVDFNPFAAPDTVPPLRTVNGVEFQSDNAPPLGFTSIGPQLVNDWETKPEFGASADDDNLESIYSDIRWTQNGVNPPLEAIMDVTPGLQYRLQVLFYGNHQEFRGWDIQIDGVDAIDNITSLGIDIGAGPPVYNPNSALVYSYDFTAPDNQVNVVFGQLFGLGPEALDTNAIWQGITLEQIPEPSTALTLTGVAAVLGLLRRRRSGA